MELTDVDLAVRLVSGWFGHRSAVRSVLQQKLPRVLGCTDGAQDQVHAGGILDQIFRCGHLQTLPARRWRRQLGLVSIAKHTRYLTDVSHASLLNLQSSDVIPWTLFAFQPRRALRRLPMFRSIRLRSELSP